ncbi:hypothetical protein [Streptomyces aquilus]|uniref:hypothetical protein n=1 Tax=Streptomyces aquilus TaxID=2548456 RepID=UPI00367610F6
MKSGLWHEVATKRRSRVLAAAASALAAAIVGVSMLSGGGPVDRPAPPGRDLAGQLDALRGANDLVRSSRTDVGRDPALYPTAYGRLEASIPRGRRNAASVPEARVGALAALARTDALDTPAWRAHYVCLSLTGSPTVDAATVLERAGLRKRAESEALAYLRAPDSTDDALTSLATRAAFLQTLTCLGRDGTVSSAVLRRLATDAALAEQPVPVLYAVEALRSVGVRALPTRALQRSDALLTTDCRRLAPMQRAALALLRHTLPERTRSCLVTALKDGDTQTRWLVRRALTIGGAGEAGRLPAPVGSVRADGLVAKSPTQLGTLTATYNAVRALTATAQQDRAPQWLTRRLADVGSDPDLDPSDRVLLAMTCHRLALHCGPEAEKGAREAARLKVPTRLTAENQRIWYGAMAARAEFGLGCRHTSVETPGKQGTALTPRSLDIVVVLADAGCTAQARRLTAGADLVAQTRTALRDGDLLIASDALQAALASDQDVPQALWDEVPRLVERYRDVQYPDLYAGSPGGAASADATRAAYYLLA